MEHFNERPLLWIKMHEQLLLLCMVLWVLLVEGTSEAKPTAFYNTFTYAKQHRSHVKPQRATEQKVITVFILCVFLINLLPVKIERIMFGLLLECKKIARGMCNYDDMSNHSSSGDIMANWNEWMNQDLRFRVYLCNFGFSEVKRNNHWVDNCTTT